MGSKKKMSNLVALKLMELFLHGKQPIWVALGFEDVFGLNMRNKCKMVTNIMEFGASSYPFGYITSDEVLGMICSISSILWKWLCWLHFNILAFSICIIFRLFSSYAGESFIETFIKSSPKESISITFFTRELDSSNLTCIDSSIVNDLLKTL